MILWHSVSLTEKSMRWIICRCSNKVSHRRFDPYKLFMYNNAWFMLGYDKKSYEIRYFKLSRIQSMVVTENRFTVLATYKESDYLDDFGMKRNGMRYDIVVCCTADMRCSPVNVSTAEIRRLRR